MNIEAITRQQKVKETVKFTSSFMKMIGSMSIFCLITVFLFDEEGKSLIHSVIVTSSSFFTVYLFEKGIVGYKTAICLSFVTDGICLDLAIDKFKNFSSIFVIIAHQLFIQSCVFNYYTQPFGYIIIAVRTIVWQYFMNEDKLFKIQIPTEIPCTLIVTIVSEIFFVRILEKKTNGDIATRIDLEYQLNYLKGILQEIAYGILVVDEKLKVKFKNRAYEDLFGEEDFLRVYNDKEKKDKSLETFFKGNQSQVHIGKFFVGSDKVSCNARKGYMEEEKFAILTFNKIMNRGNDEDCDQELLLANMLQELSHDLKTPLNAIINNQREAIENKFLSKEVKSSLKKSYNNSCVLLCFIQDIIDYSKLNSDLLIVNPHLFNVSNLIKECSKFVKHAFMKNCKFSIQENVSKKVYFDQYKLRSILISIFYTLCSCCPLGEITLDLKNSIQKLKFLFTVKSNSFKLIEQTFESFKYKITNEIVAKLTGSPLKLAKSPDLSCITIEMDLLTEWDTDTDNEGISEFQFNTNDPDSELFITEFIDILIVDDLDFNCAILKRMLLGLKEHCKCSGKHEKKFTVHTANSGKDAIQLIQLMNKEKKGYKVIFMDCQMPDLDGWDTSKIINDLFRQKMIYSLPYIIAYSAYDVGKNQKQYKEAGMCDHLSKPCLREELCGVLQFWMSKPLRRV